MEKYAVIFICFCCIIFPKVFSLEYDPDVDLRAPQIIRRHGYPAETHIVVTDDGYLLTMHRIPHGKNHYGESEHKKPAVFLQHGMLAASTDWILNGPGKSLAYVLADNGYDVWMGNARGNTYSNGHVNLSTYDSKYWNFTWNEMAMHDLPAEIDYILLETNHDKIFYVGHSMGTTMFFAMASEKPDYAKKVHAMFALAPVAYMEHIRSPIRLLAPWAHNIEVDAPFLAHYLGEDAFLPQNKIMRALSRYGCEAMHFEREICANAIFIICGFDRAQFNMSLLPIVLSHTPAGTSTRTLVHYAQEINSGKFCQFDYGPYQNQLKYNSTTPPDYNLSAITTPIVLHYADNDWLASEVDVDRLHDQLPNCIGKYLVKFPGFNHLDFLWGIDVKTLVYDKILEDMKKMSNEIIR